MDITAQPVQYAPQVTKSEAPSQTHAALDSQDVLIERLASAVSKIEVGLQHVLDQAPTLQGIDQTNQAEPTVPLAARVVTHNGRLLSIVEHAESILHRIDV